MMKIAMAWGVGAVLLVAAGCAVDVEVDPGPGPGSATLPAGFRALVPGVTFIAPTCAPGALEACNGRDDDCDGWIDNGCGVDGGDGVQVVLSQTEDAHYSLSVESPVGGHRLNSSSEDVMYGGRFSRPREESCVFESDEDYIESAYWASPEAPTGTYRVDFGIFSDCMQFDGETDVQVEAGIAIGGQFIGTFRWTERYEPFASSSREPVLEFDVE